MRTQVLTMIFLFAATAGIAAEPKPMIVKVDVADVRAEMKKHDGRYVYDPLQETQVLKGERVLVYETKGKWARIQAPEQIEFTHNSKWEGYPGWIELKYLSPDLSLAKTLAPPNVFDDALRWQILNEAKRHLGSSYLWGGRSLHDKKKKTVTGVDCSGLVNWSYLQLQWLVPRDAHEQFMQARRLEPKQMKPADLIFLAKPERADKVVHVALYEGNGTLIEAPQSGEPVREISFETRFGKKIDDVKNGDHVGDRIIYFGTLFPEDK